MEIGTYGELLKDRKVNLDAKVDTQTKSIRRWRPHKATEHDLLWRYRDPTLWPELEAMVSDSSDTEEIDLVTDEEVQVRHAFRRPTPCGVDFYFHRLAIRTTWR
mgnify:CR=1 FL=1